MRKKEKWLVFKLKQKGTTAAETEICAYTIRGTFSGEMENTKELLAQKHNCKPEDIIVEIEEM